MIYVCIREVQITYITPGISVDTLREEMRTICGFGATGPTQFTMKWIDDEGDPCRIATQHELDEALRLYKVEKDTEITIHGPGAAVEEPPCSMMIQGGSFYSYTAATAAAAAAAVGRRIPGVEGGPSTSSTGIQVLPRDRPIKSSSSTYPPSPSSDSAEYEQPIASMRTECSPHNSPRDDIFAQPGTSSSRIKLLCDKGIDDTSDVDIDEVTATEIMYATANRGIGTSTCRVHGPCNPPPDSAPTMPPLIDDTSGSSQFWFNDITWDQTKVAKKVTLTVVNFFLTCRLRQECPVREKTRAFCAFCQDRIWGLGRQGFKCIQCKLLVHKKCHKVVRKPCLSVQQQQQQQMPSTDSQTIDRNGDQQQLDSVQCSPVAHLEDEISELPIIEEHSRNRKNKFIFLRVIDKIDQSEFEGFEYVNPLLMSLEDCV
ncbi:hypothetical protein E2986_08643 [Frieseomelitta varia]|uniref:Protein kinase C n=1 Tax=Frieseomelitta varia TaxID=561572 RepID=A0A833RPY4_9HYME|nr:hypothetical protein E2986_08643 [Frieseomelitta varia]